MSNEKYPEDENDGDISLFTYYILLVVVLTIDFFRRGKPI